jgi:phosphoribosyl-AMP cyclohydrolase
MTDPNDSAGESPAIRFGADGLVPAVIQDVATDAVLMVGFMNEEALRRTRQTGRVHFWSRSRQALWRKGETSGHEQIVEEIRVNCERNSLLVRARQVGAVCHDGYESCFYRRLEPDDGLTVVLERAFDPASVYGQDPGSLPASSTESDLERLCRLQFGAYAFLKDNDLSAESGTSARSRGPIQSLIERLTDELLELAGALDGSHRHRDLASDVALEGGQVVYWATLVALRAGGTWEQLRTDRALLTAEPGFAASTAAALLRAQATEWNADSECDRTVVARCQSSIALVGQACAVAAVGPIDLITHDLAELRAKPYLAAFFASE